MKSTSHLSKTGWHSLARIMGVLFTSSTSLISICTSSPCTFESGGMKIGQQFRRFFFTPTPCSLVAILLIFVTLCLVASLYFEQPTKTIRFDSSHACLNSSVPYCAISEDYQFKRFFMFALDGVSWEFVQPLLDLFGEHLHAYTTYTSLCRFTQAIFRTWCTGRENRNLEGFSVREDTIFHSYFRTYGKKMQIAFGNSWYLRLFAEPYEPYFSRLDGWYDHPPADDYHVFGRWIHPSNRTAFLMYADETEKANGSVVTHFGDTDMVQHRESDTYLVCSYFFLCGESNTIHFHHFFFLVLSLISHHPLFVSLSLFSLNSARTIHSRPN